MFGAEYYDLTPMEMLQFHCAAGISHPHAANERELGRDDDDHEGDDDVERGRLAMGGGTTTR